MTNNNDTLINYMTETLRKRQEGIDLRRRFLHQASLEGLEVDYSALELELAQMIATSDGINMVLQEALALRQ